MVTEAYFLFILIKSCHIRKVRFMFPLVRWKTDTGKGRLTPGHRASRRGTRAELGPQSRVFLITGLFPHISGSQWTLASEVAFEGIVERPLC